MDLRSQILNSSPLFTLSMASKELFHSNMLFWICKTYREEFLHILKALDVDTNNWPNDWVAHREKDHFDFSITDKDNNNYFLIIENKVKSIPYKEQLDKYQNEVKNSATIFVLLSLSTSNVGLDNLDEQWKIKSYHDLALAIAGILPNIHDLYHRMLLEDYFTVISELHKQQMAWLFVDKNSYTQQFVEGSENEEVVGLGDVRKKVLYSQLAAKVQKKLNAEYASNKEIKKSQKDNQVGQVYVNWGMTRSMGLLDVKVRIHKNLLFVIQVQGAAYRHCVETLDKENEELNFEVISSLKNYLDNKEITQDPSNIAQMVLDNGFLKRRNDSASYGYPFSQEMFDIPQSKEYNQFGNTFIYQYIKLKEEVTVKALIEAIHKDVEKLRQLVELINPNK